MNVDFLFHVQTGTRVLDRSYPTMTADIMLEPTHSGSLPGIAGVEIDLDNFSVPVEPDLFFDVGVQTFAIAHRQLEDALIGGEDKDVPRGVENGGANLAMLEMLLHELARFGREGVIEKFGDAIPDLFAVDHQGNLLRFGASRRSCGARRLCNRIRARCKRTLTEATLMFSA
jgi:hypothetical protein